MEMKDIVRLRDADLESPSTLPNLNQKKHSCTACVTNINYAVQVTVLPGATPPHPTERRGLVVQCEFQDPEALNKSRDSDLCYKVVKNRL